MSLPKIETSRTSSTNLKSSRTITKTELSTPRKKLKTVASDRQSQENMNVLMRAKLRLQETQRSRKNAQKLQEELKKHLHRQEQFRLGQILSSDEEQNVKHSLRQWEPETRTRIKSLQSQERPTLDLSQPLVAPNIIQKFYNVHKDLDKVQQLQRLNGKISPITMILRLLADLRIPPKKLDIIRESGNRNILNLKNCGLSILNNAQLLNEILQKIKDFQVIDLSHNGIHLDVVDKIIPELGLMRVIDLSHNKIARAGCHILAKLFAKSTTKIEILELESNELSDVAGIELLHKIPVCKTLKILNLSRNSLGSGTGIALSRILMDPSQPLTQLYLHWNQIGEDGTGPLFQSLVKNENLRVLDVSWNYQKETRKMIQPFRNFIENNRTLVHLDVSYCSFGYEDSKAIKKSLASNHTIYGLHFQGNQGHIDLRGNLILADGEQKLVQYPMPLHKSVSRRIRGVQPCREQEYYGIDKRKNICWICMDYQQFEFRLKKPEGMSGMECFVHVERQSFRGFKLLERDDEYFVKKMLPKGKHRFFFTIGRDYRTTSENFQKQSQKIFIEWYKIGRVRFYDIVVDDLNVIDIKDSTLVIDSSDFLPNVECRPRQKLNKINLKNLVMRKRLVERLQKMKFQLKQLPVVREYKPSQKQMQQQFKKCILYDLENSKIMNIVGENKVNAIKSVLLQYYREIWTAYDCLSSTAVSDDGNVTITQQSIIDFATEIKYVTKRIPLSKIVLKYVGSLKKDSNMKRPQFVEFLVRIADEKWSREDKQFFKSAFHLAAKEKMIQRSPSIRKTPSRKGSVLRRESFLMPLTMQRQQSQHNDMLLTGPGFYNPSQRDQEESESKSIGKREREVVPIEQGLQRVLKPFLNYYLKYNFQNWRQRRFMTPDIKLLLDAYSSFLNKLFEKYAKWKVYGKYKTISYFDFTTIFIKASIVVIRSNFPQGQKAYIMSRTIDPIDSQPYALSYEEFCEALGRLAETFSFAPIGFGSRQIFRNQRNRSELPLVFKMQSLLNIIYRGHSDLCSAKITSMFQDGIFREEIETYIEIATQRYMNQTELILQPRVVSTRAKFNNMVALSELTLKDLIQALRLKYSNIMIKKYDVVEQLQEDDEEDEQPQ